MLRKKDAMLRYVRRKAMKGLPRDGNIKRKKCQQKAVSRDQ